MKMDPVQILVNQTFEKNAYNYILVNKAKPTRLNKTLKYFKRSYL